MQNYPDFDANPSLLQVQNPAYRLIERTIGLNHIIMDMGQISIDRNADHEVRMPNFTERPGEFRI